MHRASSVSETTVSMELIDVEEMKMFWPRRQARSSSLRFLILTTPFFHFFFVNWKYKITNFSKVITDIRLLPWFCPLANNFECMRYWRCLCLADYGQTWRHPQNWKCITYCIVVRQGPSHGHNNTNLTSTENFVKFGRVVFKICERRHRQTGSLQYFAPLLGRSNIITQCCFYCSHIHFMRNNNNTDRKLWAYRLTYDSLNDDRLKLSHRDKT